MKIILEGCDGTGKTTLAKMLAEKYKLDICHCTQYDPTDFDFYKQTARKDNIVWDRHTIGELVYPFVFDRKPKISPQDALLVLAYAKEAGAKIFILTADLEEIIRRIKSRGNEDERILNKIKWIDDRFRYYADFFDIPLIDTSKMTFSEIFNLVEKEEPPYKFIHKKNDNNKIDKEIKNMSKNYNKTQLTPQQEFERHIYHRDQFAHYLRWTHVLKEARIGQKILDFGCGSGEMLEVFYRNKYRPAQYLGLDIRQKTIDENNYKFEKLDFAEFRQRDLCQPDLDLGQTFDIITCFEVIEHIGHENADVFLKNIARHCNENTRVYLSTPNYDPQVGAANNHLLGPNKEIGEWDHFELQSKLSEYFEIEKKYGTFASMKDYKTDLKDWQIPMFEALKDYYDTNLIANIMAPLIPAEHARNCLWVLKIKEN